VENLEGLEDIPFDDKWRWEQVNIISVPKIAASSCCQLIPYLYPIDGEQVLLTKSGPHPWWLNGRLHRVLVGIDYFCRIFLQNPSDLLMSLPALYQGRWQNLAGQPARASFAGHSPSAGTQIGQNLKCFGSTSQEALLAGQHSRVKPDFANSKISFYRVWARLYAPGSKQSWGWLILAVPESEVLEARCWNRNQFSLSVRKKPLNRQ